MKRELLSAALVRSGAASLLQSLQRWHGVIGLNYHRIGRADGDLFDRGIWSATEQGFDEQLRFLKRETDVISLDDLGDRALQGKGRYVVITFDDGYRDNYESAFPILQRHGLTAAFFVSTGFLDAPKLPWWDEIAWMVRTSKRERISVAGIPGHIYLDAPDREAAVGGLLRIFKASPTERTGPLLDAIAEGTGSGRFDHRRVDKLWMTWDMVREMRAGGMTIGGHTVDHTILARMTPEGQQAQVHGCGERIQQELGEPMRFFAYPVGGKSAFDQITRDVLRDNGVELGFSYYGGFRRFDDWDPYDVRRFPVDSDTSFDAFRATVLVPQLAA